jgi:C-terminal processing protease CtpA/Prc
MSPARDRRLAAGYGIAQWRGPGAPAAARFRERPKQVTDHGLLDEVAERVRTEYVDPVVNGKLEQAAVAGMVASLDPHSALLDPRNTTRCDQHGRQLHRRRHRSGCRRRSRGRRLADRGFARRDGRGAFG